DLVTMKSLSVVDGKVKEGDIPGEIMDDAKSWREKLTEAVAETDDDLLAKYLEAGGIEGEEMLTPLGKAVSAGTLRPVLRARPAPGPPHQAVPVSRGAGGRGGDRPPHQAAGDPGRRSQGAAGRRRLQDHRRSPRGQALPLPRLFRNLQGGQPGLQRDPGQPGA